MNSSLTSKIWDVRQVWFGVISYFFLAWLAYLSYPFLRQIFPSTPDTFISLQLIVLIFAIISCYFIYCQGGLTLSDVLIPRSDFWILGIGLFILFLNIELIWGTPSTQPGPYEVVRSLPNPQFLIYILEFVFVGTFLEELLYRKYFLEILRKRFSIVTAVFLTMVIETSFHFDHSKIGLIYIFFWSMIHSIIYLKSRLGVSFCLHAANNGLLILFSLGPFYPLR
jgi:membrane protease YdiL (CAAX protease family)